MTHHKGWCGCHRSKAYDRCEGRKKFQSVSEVIGSKGEGVKRKLRSWKVRIFGIKEFARDSDYTDMK